MRRAFTLIELLIVIAILALIMGILFPAISHARVQARRTVCANNLREIGRGFLEYLTESRDILPYASLTPSNGPAPLTTDKAIYIADVLRGYVGNDEIFRCPDDVSGISRPPPNEGRSYFESEKSSYEYRTSIGPRFLLGGKRVEEVSNLINQWTNRVAAPNSIWLMRDYNNFHGRVGSVRARSYLYVDGHVGDFEN